MAAANLKDCRIQDDILFGTYDLNPFSGFLLHGQRYSKDVKRFCLGEGEEN